jgi:CRISPR system Cascade subunit CasB
VSETVSVHPAAEGEPQRSRRPVRALGVHVRSVVNRLAHGYLADRPASVAALAKLRGALGKPLGAVPEVLQWTIAGLPEPDSGFLPVDEPSWAELSSHTAITLFAVHQQSIRDRRMNTEGRSIAAAAGLLHARGVNADGVTRRFEALGTAATWDETVRHARGLIRMLNAERIALDYGYLADDLFDLKRGAGDQVRLRWGRDFYRSRLRSETDASSETSAD